MSYAQTTNRNVKRNVATVLFSTIGGAALGLSTLSFYGEPQEHTDNVTLGALIGLIGGIGYVALDSTKPAEKPFDYSQVSDLDLKSKRALAFSAKALPLVQFQYDF